MPDVYLPVSIVLLLSQYWKIFQYWNIVYYTTPTHCSYFVVEHWDKLANTCCFCCIVRQGLLVRATTAVLALHDKGYLFITA